MMAASAIRSMIVMVGMIVMMCRHMALSGLCRRQRVKRSRDLDQLRSKVTQLLSDLSIAQDQDAFCAGIHGDLLAAKRPGKRKKMRKITPAYFKQFLVRISNFDRPAILKHQPVTGAQFNCLE